MLALLALLGGFFGRVHPVGDSLAVFRPQLALVAGGLGLLIIWLRSASLGIVALVAAAGSWLSLILPLESAPKTFGTYLLYQKNMSFRNPDWKMVAADIADTRPGFVTLQEVSKRNRPLLDALRPEFPAQLYCDFATVGGTAVLSRFPALAGQSHCEKGMSALQVMTPDGPVWLVSMHLHWPWPFGQDQHLSGLRTAIAALEGPKIIAGDFNMVKWSWALQSLAKDVGGLWERETLATLPLARGVVKIPIDHVLTPLGVSAEIRPFLGSDHLGVLANLSLPDGKGRATQRQAFLP